MRKGKRKTPSTTLANTTTPVPKRYLGTDSLMRDSLPDIVAAVLNAFSNATTTTTSARSSHLTT